MAEVEPPSDADEGLDVAIVGMAGRFPKAPDVETFWRNLRSGICSVTTVDRAELESRGVPAEMIDDPDFVPAAYLLEGSDGFDAAFFGCSPREAELMDPQHRVLLECASAAIEDAGIDPSRYDGLIGVFAGAGHNTYLLNNVTAHAEAAESIGGKQVLIGNRPDFLTSRISYKLGLEGPSVTVQSACSTSLVATVQACQALLAFECDVALAGGVAVDPTRHTGYLHREDGILSPDGLTRTLDARAAGTVGGDGTGMVVLKRLQDALTDRDHIRAVVKGWAINNDGARRAGFSAPSATSQARVIVRALAHAGVEPSGVRYVELHGTATHLGDPIEMAALTTAYAGVPQGHCAVGSVKTNVGHLDAAAGVAGLIKAALVVERGEIPPSLHFDTPNPRLDLDNGPFRVSTELAPFPDGDEPRRAAVSSFGLGGTNAHVVLEQAPEEAGRTDAVDEQVVVLSARSEAALDAATDRLQEHLRAHRGLRLDDIALTLQNGRSSFGHRRMVVARDTADLLSALEARDDGRLLSGAAPDIAHRPIAFLVGGFGSQFPGMASELYRSEPVFRAAIDRCAELAAPLLDDDLRDVLIHGVGDGSRRPATKRVDLRRMLEQPERSEHPIDQPGVGYPAVFAFEYALAELWASWGVRPDAMIGHSLGEYVAACVAGVFSLGDAVELVIRRARLIERHGEGAMVAVPLGYDEATAHCDDEVSVAAINDPLTCVLSGTAAGIERVVEELDVAGIVSRRLTSPYAYHSPAMDPVVEPYAALLGEVPMKAPTIPFVSNVTGTWITDEQATSPDYWARHLRLPVRFSDGVGTLWSVPDVALVEIGAGQTLTASALQHPAASASPDRTAVPSLPGAFAGGSDRSTLLRAAGRLWLAGRSHPVPPIPHGRRIPLPTYPFERRRFWLDPAAADRPAPGRLTRTDSARWFHTPTWHRTANPAEPDPNRFAADRWLVFADDTGLGRRLADRLRSGGAGVTTVAAGAEWSDSPDEVVVDPGSSAHLDRLADLLRTRGPVPTRVLHCWGVGRDADGSDTAAGLLDRSFHSLVRWAQATESEMMSQPQRWDVVTSEVASVLGDEPLCPPKAAVQGIAKVVQQEYPTTTCVHWDVQLPPASDFDELAARLLAGLAAPPSARTVAVRGRHSWIPGQEPTALHPRLEPPVQPGGVSVITGGLGKIGLIFARALADRERVRLVLLGRNALPSRPDWERPQPDDVRARISAVQALEASGSEVLVVSADVADRGQMSSAVEAIVSRFGHIDGVVHCAGTTGDRAHRTIGDVGQEEADWHFGPKLAGATILRDLLGAHRLDFAILCSSIASLLGGLGFSAYAAANAALDAFAVRYHGPGQPWCSVNWEAWRFSTDSGEEPRLGAAVEALAVTPDEGRRIVDQLLSTTPEPQIIVSTGDLAVRREMWASPAVEAPAAPAHARPNLNNPFVAPTTETERQIAEIWQQILGVDRVGLHDNFFELGGNSLLGLQVVHRLRTQRAMVIPLTVVYEGPTVRTLADLVARRAEQS